MEMHQNLTFNFNGIFHFSRKPIHFMNKIVVSRVIYKYLMSFEMDFHSAFNNIPVFIW